MGPEVLLLFKNLFESLEPWSFSSFCSRQTEQKVRG